MNKCQHSLAETDETQWGLKVPNTKATLNFSMVASTLVGFLPSISCCRISSILDKEKPRRTHPHFRCATIDLDIGTAIKSQQERKHIKETAQKKRVTKRILIYINVYKPVVVFPIFPVDFCRFCFVFWITARFHLGLREVRRPLGGAAVALHAEIAGPKKGNAPEDLRNW